MIIYIQYMIGLYLILSLILAPLFIGNNDSKLLFKFLKPMPLAISFFPLYYGYNLIINKKIVGNELYEIDLSIIASWVPYSLGLFFIIVGFTILYKSYGNK